MFNNRRTAANYLRRRDLEWYEGYAASNVDVWLTAYEPIEEYFKGRIASAPLNWEDIDLEWYKGYPLLVKKTCDRCQKKITPPGQRLLKPLVNKKAPDFQPMFLESCQCHDCINCTIVDQYMYDTYDKNNLPDWHEARQVFSTFGGEYEKAWRIVLANAPKIMMTEEEWEHRANFFGGCAFCGRPIEVRGYFFPRRLNGDFTPWNVIPLCGECLNNHYRGRSTLVGATHRYRVFSNPQLFTKYKTIRMYLLSQMAEHGIWMEPLIPHMKRFLETRTLKGSRMDGISGTPSQVATQIANKEENNGSESGPEP